MAAKGETNLAWVGESNPRWTPKIIKNCEHCGKQIVTTAYKLSRSMGKYCSHDCSSKAKAGKKSNKPGGVVATCKECGAEFKTIQSRISRGRGKFCSKECDGQYRAKHSTPWNKGRKSPETSGAKNPFWKGGVTPEYQQIRTSLEYKIWRNAVINRDGRTCQGCGSKGKLHAHHILSFKDFPHKRFDISNGISLCIPCHFKHHNKTYKGENK